MNNLNCLESLSHRRQGLIKKICCFLALLNHFLHHSGAYSVQVPTQLLHFSILEEAEAFALPAQQLQALDVVVEEAGQVLVRTTELRLALRSVQIKVINCVFKDPHGLGNLILKQKGAPE